MKRARRIGAEDSTTRTEILDATEQLMLSEGYAAVSTRQVAKKIGLTPALVHYYFPTTDDLLVAAYRRAVDRTIADLNKVAAESDHPLRALWTHGLDATCTALASEFMAMANHRKSIRAELASSSEAFRKLQTKLLTAAGDDTSKADAVALTVLMAGVSRLLVLEKTLGISFGHRETRALVDTWLDRHAVPAKGRTATSRRTPRKSK